MNYHEENEVEKFYPPNAALAYWRNILQNLEIRKESVLKKIEALEKKNET